MPTDPTGPAPEVSAEGRRLIEAHHDACICQGGHPCGINAADAASTHDALSVYVAGLEAEVARLRSLASGAVFHLFCCGAGAHTDADDCGQFVPAMADLAKAIGFEADPATNAEIAAVPLSQATQRRIDAAQRGRTTEGGE